MTNTRTRQARDRTGLRCKVPDCNKPTATDHATLCPLHLAKIRGEASVGPQDALRAPRRQNRARGDSRYLCACGETWGSYLAAERCADTHHGGRIDIQDGPR